MLWDLVNSMTHRVPGTSVVGKAFNGEEGLKLC